MILKQKGKEQKAAEVQRHGEQERKWKLEKRKVKIEKRNRRGADVALRAESMGFDYCPRMRGYHRNRGRIFRFGRLERYWTLLSTVVLPSTTEAQYFVPVADRSTGWSWRQPQHTGSRTWRPSTASRQRSVLSRGKKTHGACSATKTVFEEHNPGIQSSGAHEFKLRSRILSENRFSSNVPQNYGKDHEPKPVDELQFDHALH